MEIRVKLGKVLIEGYDDGFFSVRVSTGATYASGHDKPQVMVLDYQELKKLR